MAKLLFWWLGVMVLAGGVKGDEKVRLQYLEKIREALKPIHRKLGSPGPHDWLAHHHEPGETFHQYLKANPLNARGKRHVIYIQPLGEFSRSQRTIVELTAEFMGCYFSLPVKIKHDIPLSEVPAQAQRIHPYWGMKQVLTTYVLEKILKPRLPQDAAAYLALTAADLWPGEGWNFVFGQASLRERVGVWSIFRNGDPDQDRESFRLCLLRTLKTASHETGHMFSMKHCIAFACNMCGSNHRQESDQRPLALCPECLCKLCWATAADPMKRFQNLHRFCRDQGLRPEANFYEKSIRTIQP